MNYLIVINAPPKSNTSLHAIEFIKSALQLEHTIEQLFFIGSGVLTASPPSSVSTLPRCTDKWITLIDQYQLDAVCCSNAIAQYAPSLKNTIAAQFQIAGMAQLITSSLMADRTITFGLRAPAGALL